MSAPFTNPQGLQPGLVYYTPLESGKPSGPTQTYGMGGGGPYGQPGPPPPGTGYNPIPNPAYSPDASYWEAVYGMSKAEWLAAGQPPKPANSQPYYLPGTGGMPGTAPKNIIPLAPGDTFNVNKPSTGYGAALPATQNPGDNMPYPGSAGPSDPQNPGYTQGPGSVAPPPVIPSSGNGGGGSSGGGSFQGGSGSPDLFGDAYLYDEDPASAVGLCTF